MGNWKHSMSAFLAVVMVGSLGTFQMKDIPVARADKAPDEEIVLDILVGDGEGETLDFDQADMQKVKEKVEKNFAAVQKVEMAKPFEPKTGYVIATSGPLNVRAEKDDASEVIGTLAPGSELWLEGEYESWYQISYTKDDAILVGYVSKEFVTTSYEEAKNILLADVMYQKAVIAPGNEMKSAPSMDASPMQQFTDEAEVVIISKVDDNWSQVYVTSDYTAGYVLNSALTEKDMVLRDQVFADRQEKIKAIATPGIIYAQGGSVDVRMMPGDDKETKINLTNGTSCLLVKEIDGWMKISYGDNYSAGYVRKEAVMTKEAYDAMKAEEERQRQIAAKKAEEERKKAEAAKKAAAAQKAAAAAQKKSASSAKKSQSTAAAQASIPYAAPSSRGQQIVNAASKCIGIRYVYGGTSTSGFDCSGLVQYACRQAGVSVNRTSGSQYSNGVAVSKSDLQPGDLVFFSKGSSISHVGIYAGNGQVIHSPRPGKSVCYTSLASMCSYSRYVGARRVY